MTEKWYNKILPKNLFEWVAVIGFLLYIGKELYIYLGAYGSDLIHYLIMKVGFFGLFSSVIAMIADGIRRMGRGGQSWKTTLTLLAGILLPLAFISAGVYSHYEFHRMEELLLSNEHSIQRIAERLRRHDLSPEKYSVMSRIYAREVYSARGRIISYITPDGKQVLYQPTEKDKEFREAIIETKKAIEFRKPALLKITYTWLLSILLGISCGLFARSKWKSKDHHITK